MISFLLLDFIQPDSLLSTDHNSVEEKNNPFYDL